MYTRIYVDSSMVVTDLVSNDTLEIVKYDSTRYSIDVAYGKRHALRVQKDTITTYTFLEPRRGVFGMSYEEKYLLVRVEDGVHGAERVRIEDSLRKRVRPVIPTSLVYDRDYAVVNLWVTAGYEGPTTQAVIGPSSGSIGIGLVIVPWVMPLYERGSVSYVRTGDLYDTESTWEAAGICLQEPVIGLYVAWKYGWMNVNGYSSNDHVQDPRPRYDASVEFYTLAAGFYGQWGRLEYRHRRNTAWTSPPQAPDLSGRYGSLHFTFHIFL